MSYRQLFPLVVTPKEQHVGAATNKTSSKPCRVRAYATSTDVPVMLKPKYETEREVTLAIVSGELKFGTELAYENARLWQKYQKSLKPKFFPKKDDDIVPKTSTAKYMRVMFQK